MASPLVQPADRVATRRRVEWTVWLVAAGLLIAGGARHVVQYARDMPPALSGDRAASDRSLTVLGMSKPAAAIEAALAALPSDETLYLVVPADNPFRASTYFAISPLVWPRPFGMIGCTGGGGAEQVLFPVPPQPPGSRVNALLWNPLPQPDAPPVVVAPADADAQPIGPQLQLVTGQEGDAWALFCSP